MAAISVVIAARDAAATIGEVLDSLRALTGVPVQDAVMEMARSRARLYPKLRDPLDAIADPFTVTSFIRKLP